MAEIHIDEMWDNPRPSTAWILICLVGPKDKSTICLQ